jgi:hypothetical protein
LYLYTTGFFNSISSNSYSIFSLINILEDVTKKAVATIVFAQYMLTERVFDVKFPQFPPESGSFN